MCQGRAKSAPRLIPRLGFQRLADLLTGRGKEPLGPANSTVPKSKPDGATILTPDRLLRRGLSLHNRHEASAKKYAAIHLAMMDREGSCEN